MTMYGWNDDTDKWKHIATEGSYKFKSAKAPYLEKMAAEAPSGPRTYTDKPQPGWDLVNPMNRDLESLSEDPILIVVDGTMSMQTLPAEFHDRAPLIGKTLYQYRPDTKGKLGCEISFGVIGDHKWDQWPLQVADFGKGVSLEKALNALHAEGGGGPGIRESYELFAYFALNHVKTPNATRPFLFIIGDEMFYPTLHPETVKKHFGDTIDGPLDSIALWKEVSNRYEVFFLRRPYPPHDEKIVAQWSEALEPQRIIPIYDIQRVADVIMAAVACRWGEYSDFKLSMASRQGKEGIAIVEKSLMSAPALVSAAQTPALVSAGVGKLALPKGASSLKKLASK